MNNLCVWEHLLPADEVPAMRLRSFMMRRLVREIKSWGQNPEVICLKLYISNGRLQDLLSGHIDLFNYDDLIELLKCADLNIEQVLKEGIRS
jgi:predicted XRE-type DNA-binding protein